LVGRKCVAPCPISPIEAKEERQATEEAEPPEEPPGVIRGGGVEVEGFRYGMGFMVGPKALCGCWGGKEGGVRGRP